MNLLYRSISSCLHRPCIRSIIWNRTNNYASLLVGSKFSSITVLTNSAILGVQGRCDFDQPARRSTIFTSLPANQLWEGVTGPPGSTKKRARGKRRVTRPKVDLNRGQRLGMGKAHIEWPGLNVPVLDKSELRTIKKGEFNEVYFNRLEELRTKFATKKKRSKLPPLLRGWCGSRIEGQSIGPPSPEHPDFDTRVIEMKVVATMTATVGRYRRFSVLVATGNGRGLCGIGKAKAITLNVAVRRAKQRASENVYSFNLKEDRTLWHIGYVKQWHSGIFAQPAVEGAGLTCHRLIKTLCHIIGIKDMYAKVEGNTKNYQVITQGFLRLLAEQEPYDAFANRTGLHVVEFTTDRDNYPRLLASPSTKPISCSSPHLSQQPSNKSTQYVSPSDDPTVPLPILAISHPDRHRPRKPPPERYESFLDDLVEVGEGEPLNTTISDLLASGERDLDSLVLGGRVPRIRHNPDPGYWKDPGNLKVAAERFRYRNHDAVLRQRKAYAALDELREK